MTCLLAVAAMQIKARLSTFDISPTMSLETICTLSRIGEGGVEVNTVDSLSSKGINLIESRIKLPGTSLVLCDGGNKVQEFLTFSPFLKPGDVIAAHDFGGREAWPWVEITIDQVSEVLKKENISRFMNDVFQDSGWLVCRKNL